MRHHSITRGHLLAFALGLTILGALPDAAAAARRGERTDICAVTMHEGYVNETLVFRDVPPLAPGDAIPLHGLFFTAARNTLPFDGSAAMAADGTVRLGLFLHKGARRSTISAPDYRLAGETDASFNGLVHLKVDGEIYPYFLLTLQQIDCATVVIP